MAVVDVKAAVVNNAALMQKLGSSKEPRLIFYRNGTPILYDGIYCLLFLLICPHSEVSKYFDESIRVYVDCGCCSVIHWRHCNTLFTSSSCRKISMKFDPVISDIFQRTDRETYLSRAS